jgi:hypothetical protein
MLFDGRNLGQNGWFIVRSLLPAHKTGKVLSWYLEPNAIPNWVRKPVIQFSQVGYRPQQEKIAVIELDKNDVLLPQATLYKVSEEGKPLEKLKATVRSWGRYLRYSYGKFDFSEVRGILSNMAISGQIHSRSAWIYTTISGIPPRMSGSRCKWIIWR